MVHFFLNSQMDRDFWLDDGLLCVSLTEVVKHNKKTHTIYSLIQLL